MTLLVPCLSGSFEEAGILNTAMSVCNIFAMISMFSVRTYQIADIDNKFSNGEYVALRFITCVISLILLPLYLIIMQYSLYLSLSVMCYMLLKIGESLIDVFQGIFQKSWRMDIVCRSYVIRGIVNLSVFAAAEWLLKNLVISLLFTALISLVLALLLDFVPCFKIFKIKINFKDKKILRLCLCCVPLFLNGILATLIANIPRLYAQKILGDEMLGYYASVATPAMVVQVAASNIFSPCVPLISEQLKGADRKIFKTIFKMFMIIFGVGVCAVLGFAWLGDWFLKTVFGDTILEYKDLLIPVIIVSILTAAAWFVTSLFTVINKNITMVVLEAIVTLIVLILSSFFIKGYGLQGVNWILISAYLMFDFIGIVIVCTRIQQSIKANGEKDNG